jgi:hypothetical protein
MALSPGSTFFYPGVQGCSNGTETIDGPGISIGLVLPIVLVLGVLSLFVMYRFRNSCKAGDLNKTAKKEVEEAGGESNSSQGKYLLDILQVMIFTKYFRDFI